MWNRDKAGRLFRGLRELGLTFAFQTSLQGLAVATGLVIIHAITKEDYGLYAMVASVQGMAAVLSDSGISTAVTSFLGKASGNPGANVGVLVVALKERRRLLAGVLPVCIAMLVALAYGKTSALILTFMVATMVSCVYLEVGTHLYQVVPLYTGQRNALQLRQMVLGAIRVALLIFLAVIQHADLLLLLGLNVAFSLAGLVLARDLVLGDRTATPIFDPELPREIHRMIMRLLPSSAFFAFQGQITTYIISLFGKLTDVASVAALGRIGLIFSVLLNVIAMVGVPAFSRARSKTEGLPIFGAVIGSVALFSLIFYIAALLEPGLMLLILGRNYANLTVELQITVISTGVTAVGGVIYTLMSSRGLVGLSWLYIVVTLAAQILYAAFGDLHTVRGVLWFGVATAGANLLNMSLQAWWLVLRPRELGRNT